MNYFNKTYYNAKYLESKEYAKHYKHVMYYPIWEEVMKNLTTEDKILDIGCGAGHLGHMLVDNGFKYYTGVDFSSVAVRMAKEKMPTNEIIEADLVNGFSYSGFSKHTIIAIEVLEHIKDDIRLIEMLPKNKIIFSVPNYIAKNHYRTYKDKEFIKRYYKNVIDIAKVKEFEMSKGNFIYVCVGKIV